MKELASILSDQSGVVSRAQIMERGLTDDDVRRLVRQRQLMRVRRGVYLDHTGEPSWRQLAWAAVLALSPAALAGPSALLVAGLTPPGRDRRIHVAIHRDRRVGSHEGVRVWRPEAFVTRVQWAASPPRIALECALIDVASTSSPSDAVALLADAVGSRWTTAERLSAEISSRARLRNRRLLRGVVEDVGTGAHSVLEQAYLRTVERAHGLPTARRQLRDRVEGSSVYRDAVYEALGVVVELDGRLHTEITRHRWADLERDLGAVASGLVTIRLGWAQVLEPCRTAERLGQVLRARGWCGQIRSCASCPPQHGDLRARGA